MPTHVFADVVQWLRLYDLEALLSASARCSALACWAASRVRFFGSCTEGSGPYDRRQRHLVSQHIVLVDVQALVTFAVSFRSVQVPTLFRTARNLDYKIPEKFCLFVFPISTKNILIFRFLVLNCWARQFHKFIRPFSRECCWSFK